MVNIGKSVIIKGELSGSEDLTIEGQVEGKIELRQNMLTIGPNGKIKAQVFAKAIIVQGEVHGNVTATERVDIRDNGSVDGDLSAPRVAIADGAHFRGSIDMQKRQGRAASRARSASRRLTPSRDRDGLRRQLRRAAPRRRRPRRSGSARTGCRADQEIRLAVLFKWGARKATETVAASADGGVCASPVTVSDVEGPAAVLWRRSRSVRVAGPARPRPGRRTEHRVLRRAAGAARFTSRTCSPTSRRYARRRTRDGSTAFARQAARRHAGDRSTASSAGTCSTFSTAPTGQALAARLAQPAAAGRRAVRLLRHDGGRRSRTTRASSSRTRTRFAPRPYPADAGQARNVLVDPRYQPDVRGPGRSTESVLLKSSTRETLFRKP